MENSEKSAVKEQFSLYEIIILACFISLVFSPVGLVLMWLKKCRWSLKVKMILSGAFALVYILAGVLIFFLFSKPESGSGSGAPFFGIEREYEGGGGSGKNSGKYEPKKSSSRKNSSGENINNSQTASQSFAESGKKKSIPVVLLFVLILGIFILMRNLKEIKSKGDDNPYVNTRLYKTPIPEGFEFPVVRYTKLPLKEEEKILFACPAEQKDNAGDIIVTDRRFVFLGKKNTLNLPLKTLSAISSVSNTAFLLTAEDVQHYFFVRDTQMRFVLQIVRWAYAKASEETGHLGYGEKSDDFGLEENSK